MLRKMKRKKIKGMTLIEIVIVLVILGVLSLFILPNIPQIRQKTEQKACIGNLWLIKMAKDQWALDENKITGEEIEWSDIVTDYIDKRPVCPKTQTIEAYTLNLVGENPSCTEDGHVIE